MQTIRPIPDADLKGNAMRIGVVVARFNSSITGALLQGAMATLSRCGVAAERIHVAAVPGAFEIPGAAMQMASRGKVDAIICLGAVIRGGTPHFEYVCQAVTEGVLRVGLDTGLPVIFGVLTCDDERQALERAGLVEPAAGWKPVDHEEGADDGSRNKGAEAALAAIETANLYRRLRGGE